MSSSNPATITVAEDDEAHAYIATSSRPGEVTMERLRIALTTTPGISNVSRCAPGQFRFTMENPPPLDELAEELCGWLHH